MTETHPDTYALTTDDYGALSQMLTFEEVDDAIDVLERLAAIRERENRAMSRYNVDVIGRADGLAVNRSLREAVEQLRADRVFRAIPEAAMDAAITCLEGPDYSGPHDD